MSDDVWDMIGGAIIGAAIGVLVEVMARSRTRFRWARPTVEKR